MLEVQKYLKSGKTLDDLKNECGVECKWHPHYPIFILDYDQINSRPNHPISDECRGLVLDTNFDIVSGCMKRFFNLGQCPDYEKEFNWDNFEVWEKRDGSMIPITVYKDDLLVRTRFSWADSQVGLSGKTWTELVLSCLTDSQIKFIKGHHFFTFIFELETPYNQVVVYHEKPQLVLLSIIDNATGKEYNQAFVDSHADIANFNRPTRYYFDTKEEALAELEKWETQGKKDEGFILYSRNKIGEIRRLKCKNRKYLEYHSMCTGIQSIRQVFEIVTNPNNDINELALYFPHLAEKLFEVRDKVAGEYSELWRIWWEVDDIKERKKLAFAITRPDSKYYTRFSSIIFRLRDLEDDTMEGLEREWKKSMDLVFKVLFKE